MKRLVLISVLLLAGCTTVQSGRTWWNPSTWFAGKAAQNVEKAQEKQSAVEDKSVTAAQIEVVKTGVALEVARTEHPDSRAVEIAKRTNGNAQALLTQREPLSLSAQQDAEAVVRGLLSTETAKREAAEKAQAAVEDKNRALSDELTKVREQLTKLQKKSEAEAAENLALANELRNQELMKWAGFAGSALLGLAAIAYRLNIGRFQEGAASLLAHIQQKHGDEAATAARSIIDGVLHTGEQKGVAKAFFELTRK